MAKRLFWFPSKRYCSEFEEAEGRITAMGNQKRDQQQQTEAVRPLTRTNREGVRLQRPPEIEGKLRHLLGLADEILIRRAQVSDRSDVEYIPSECLVHLIRRDLRHGDRQLAEDLLKPLLKRAEGEVRRAVRGFAPLTADELCEEVLSRLSISMIEKGGEADFLEVRFGLSLKRLRIDVGRQLRRRDRDQVAIEDLVSYDEAPDGDPMDRLAPLVDWQSVTTPLSQEDAYFLRQALSALSEEERRVFLLHRYMGVRIASKKPGTATLVDRLGISERTVRNRLRSAEAKLSALHETTPTQEPTS